MNTFVSSTVFDLIDVRACVERVLRGIGISPLLSDSKLSAFDATPTVNSIETCLLNVDRADAFICILDRRYGPSLKAAGFDDVSATHLEYRRALSSGVPIHFFVRDRLEADYAIWKRNTATDVIRLAWAQNQALLPFLDEHRKLENQTERSNWFSIFANATDLCDTIEARFRRQMLPERIVDALESNSLPIFKCKLSSDQISVGNVPSLQLRLECKNVGTSAAFNVRSKWETEDAFNTEQFVAPGESICPVLIANLAMGPDISVDFEISYEAALGVRIVETHNVGCIFQRGIQVSMLSGVTMKSRRFVRATRPTIEVEER